MDFSNLRFEQPRKDSPNTQYFEISQSPDRRIGRPRREPVDRIRTQAWFSHIALEEGLSAYKLEERYDKHQFRREGALTARPKKWDRYRRGDSTPNAAQVIKMAQLHPYSAELIHHPLWDVLRQRPPSILTIIDHVRLVTPALGRFLTSLSGYSGEKLCRHNLNRMTEALWKSASLDALMALVGAYRIGSAIDDLDVIVSTAMPIVSIALHQAAFGNLGHNPRYFYEYVIRLVNSHRDCPTSVPDDKMFEHAVNRMHDLREVMWRKYPNFGHELIPPLSYVLQQCGILRVYECEFRSLEDCAQWLREPEITSDEALLDFLIPFMRQRRKRRSRHFT